LLQHPEIQDVSVSSGMPLNIRSTLMGVKITNDEGNELIHRFRFDYADEDFLPVYQIKLHQGRNFSVERDSLGKAIIINQSLAREIGWKEPLGKSIDLLQGESMIVGVVEDFHFDTFHSDIGPMVLIYESGNNIAVRMKAGDVQKTMAMIERVFKRNINSQPFDYFFLSDAYNELYRKEHRTGKIFGTFSLLAVFIACLGLFGLASFSVERRTKEIGIRKILGASESRLVGLLTKNFIGLIVIANLFAWPVAFLAMHGWIRNFTYRITINIWEFLLAAAAALLIAFLTIGSQTVRAALRNPADTLRCE
ncbi:MAG: ABC transporter permease, partial [Candidatus Aminicenantes bacterium]|nr:ABC transporter permease [Candidatus Aminicenantes bacterium]